MLTAHPISWKIPNILLLITICTLNPQLTVRILMFNLLFKDHA